MKTLGIGLRDLYLKEHPKHSFCLATSGNLWAWWFLRSLQFSNFVFLFYWFCLSVFKLDLASHWLIFLFQPIPLRLPWSVWDMKQTTRWTSHSKFHSFLFCGGRGPYLSFSLHLNYSIDPSGCPPACTVNRLYKMLTLGFYCSII